MQNIRGMTVEIITYDLNTQTFRKLNKKNFTDDLFVGVVLMQRNALQEIKKYFNICGYVIIDKETRVMYPIDIQRDKIVIYEGNYNSMPDLLKRSLIKYNIHTASNQIMSSFFIRWQFISDQSCFENSGGFIKLCYNIIKSPKRFDSFTKLDRTLYEPTTYQELCEFTRSVLDLSCINIFDYDYFDDFKYLIDSLVNEFHINFSEKEITSLSNQLSNLVDERWEE